MLSKKLNPKPTDAEWNILRVLWKRGSCTVREVHEELNVTRPTGYTTVLKFMQIMTDKGLLLRDEKERAHVYRAVQTQASAQQRLLDDLVEKAFGGSAQRLVMHALSDHPTSPEELAEIRRLLDELEEKNA